MDASPLDRIRAAIEQVTGPGRHTPTGWQLRCPAHPDSNPSLSLGQNTEQHALIYCQAGCDTDAVLTAISMTRRDLYPLQKEDKRQDPVVATYRYVDEQGELLYEVLRTAAKQFRQRRPDPTTPGRWLWRLDDVRRVLYRLPLLPEAIRESQTIYVVEGEKDVHTLEGRGQVATTNPGGAGKWRPEYTEALRGAHVVVVTDRDENGQGLKHARQVVRALMAVCAAVTLVAPATGKDITDHLTAGLDLDELMILDPQLSAPAPDPQPPLPQAIVDPPIPPDAEGDVDARPRLRLTPASSFKMRPVQWVWAERMPLGEICLIPGREGIGKSTFLAWLAAQITRGELPGIYYGQPRTVLYAASEDAWDYTVAPRMFAAGADLDKVFRVDVVEADGISGKLTLPVHSRLIPEAARSVSAAMLMCDPILSNISERLNPNHAKELRVALEPLRDAAEQAGIAVAALAHFNKSRDVDVSTMVSGSRAWVEVARANIAIARDERELPNGEKDVVQVLTQTKNNLGRLDLPSLEYHIVNHQFTLDDGSDIRVGRVEWTDGFSMTTAEEVLQRKPINGHDGSGGSGRNVKTPELVLDVLDEAGRAMSPREVANALEGQASYGNVRQVLLRLLSAGKVEKVGEALYKSGGSIARARAGDVGARARSPQDVTSHLPSQVKQYVMFQEGGNVTGEGQREGGDVMLHFGGPGPSHLRNSKDRPLTSCRVCHGPLDDVDGTGVHPGCERG